MFTKILHSIMQKEHLIFQHAISYTVRSGDVLSKIAKQYNVSLQQLIKLNHIKDPDKLKVGQTLFINGTNIVPEAQHKTVKIVAGDNFYKLAKRYNVNVDDIKAANPDVNPEKLQIGQTIIIPAVDATVTGTVNNLPKSAGNKKYKQITVLSGDNYYKIAQREHTTAKAIKLANPNVNPAKLKVGQTLNIPILPQAIGKKYPESENTAAKDEALKFIKETEGTVKVNGQHVVYDDANNKNRFDSSKTTLADFLSTVKKTPTIGYGTTDLNYIKDHEGAINDSEAESKAMEDITTVCDYMPRRFGDSWNCLNRYQRAAIISFFYQQGKDQTGNPNVEKLIKAVQQNKLKLAVNYIKSNTTNQGILNRRTAQRELYNKNCKIDNNFQTVV